MPRGVLAARVYIHVNPTLNYREAYIIPDKLYDNIQPQHTALDTDTPHVIPMEEVMWDKTQKYIHKYNTRSSPRYDFSAAVIQRQSLENCFYTPP